MPRLRVCLLWHMHQPMYRDAESGEYILPWVRLHATRSYYDMASVLGEFEGARAVINVVPSLLEQLDDYVHGRARDHFLSLTQRPAEELDGREREFVLCNFFMVDWETNIRPLPRYWDLLHKRGRDLQGLDLARVARGFSVDELRDLQVLFNLAWFGFRAEEEEPVVRALKQKGRHFSEADKQAMLETQQRVLGRVVPALAEVARTGQAELTVTPFYHPILPLLIDSNSALRAMPNATLPARFSFPEDAREQVRRALRYGEEHLGGRPSGMWPAEGSVSPEAVALLAAEGVSWCATDEGVLLRSKPHRERVGATLYRPYRVRAGDGEISMLFRDRGLSDLIGFTYARSPARQGVDDLFKHLDTIARAAPRGEVPLVTIALDGENAWEHYPNSGRDFLRMLYQRLGAHENGIEPVKAGEYLARHPPTERIEELHTGSWIDSNFRVWIGHPEDNKGWSAVREARQAIADGVRAHEAGSGSALTLAQLQAAREALYVAEGSDWYWWYGDDFTTDSAAEFDALFRGYVKAAWRALGRQPPAHLDVPISRHAVPAAAAAIRQPEGFIRPRLDGRITSYFDWTGAGQYLPSEAQGSMFRSQGVFEALRFGFDERTLYLRLDPSARAVGASGLDIDRIRVELVAASGRSVVDVPLEAGRPQPHLVSGEPGRSEAPVGRASFQDILELALPFESFGLIAGMKLSVALHAMRAGIETERLPRSGHLSLVVPDPDFERKHWKV